MNSVTTKERGWAGHYILGSYCRYHRNTLIQSSDGQAVVVSSVGDLHIEKSDPIRTIGIDRYYETMTFKAFQDGCYIEADVGLELPFSDGLCYGDAGDIPKNIDAIADEMHDALVAKIVGLLSAGEVLKSYAEKWEADND